MEVRLLRDEDLEDVIAVWHEARKETHSAIQVRGERDLTLEDSRRIFRDTIVSRNEIWVAEQAGKVLGFLAIRGSYIDRMYVRPRNQGSGFGSALLRKAQELSPTGLKLHTHRANRRARVFYEKRGFRAVKFGTSPPPESEPDVEYVWGAVKATDSS